MLADYAVLDLENEIWTCANYDTFNKEQISSFVCEAYSGLMFTIAGKLQSYHLTDGEVNILRALVLFNPGKRKLLYQFIIVLFSIYLPILPLLISLFFLVPQISLAKACSRTRTEHD